MDLVENNSIMNQMVAMSVYRELTEPATSNEFTLRLISVNEETNINYNTPLEMAIGKIMRSKLPERANMSVEELLALPNHIFEMYYRQNIQNTIKDTDADMVKQLIQLLKPK